MMKIHFSSSETAAIEFLRQLVAEIPWGHHLLLLNQLTDPAAHIYYLRATAQFGWSRNVLLYQIKIGVAEYQLPSKLPAQFKGRLPTAKQLAEAVQHAREQG